VAATALLLALASAATPALAQNTRQAVETFEAGLQPLRFTPPTPRQVRLSNGVRVFLFEKHDLPTLFVTLVAKRGVANLPDSLWAAGWRADGLMRTGGTTGLSPDSVDKLIDFYALNVGFSTGQEETSAFAGGLTQYTDLMLELLADMLRNPRNDTARIREIVAQDEESWRRRNDQPASILNRAWLQTVYGDHPFARTLVKPEEARAFTPERIRHAQRMLFCPDGMVVGVVGDFQEREMVSRLERLFRGWERCPPGLRETPPLRIPEGPRLVLIERDINQTNLRMGHAGSIRVQNTPEYFATRVANWLLGGGGGFNSRLLQRVRSDSGFAYSVGSSWTADTRREGVFSAGAQTRANKTIAAISLMRRVIASMVSEPVTPDDVRLAQQSETNSFVFGFETPDQIVGRQIGYVLDGLPPNWFDLYLRGVQAVTPDLVSVISQRLLRPDRMITVVVGNPRAFDADLATLGPVTRMSLEEIVR
jgi:predicted Zn-dependent peptidase